MKILKKLIKMELFNAKILKMSLIKKNFENHKKNIPVHSVTRFL